MKILIVCPKINDQVQFLANELEKISINVEVTDSLHPLRLIFNKYDAIHFIHTDNRVNLKTVLSAWSAKSLGVATILTTYSRLHQKILNNVEFNFFDAVTLPFVSELKKMRDYRGHKIILPALTASQMSSKNGVRKKKIAYLFPIISSFEDLLKINFQAFTTISKSEDLYVDAHQLRQNIKFSSSSQIRKSWFEFIKKHPQFNHFKLFTEISTLNVLLENSNSTTFIYHLDLTSHQILFWLHTAITQNNFLILHEDQGSGFSELWKTEKNCYIYSSRLPQNTQLSAINSFIDSHDAQTRLSFDFRTSLDTKINELARLYTKVITQKTSLMQPDSANI